MATKVVKINGKCQRTPLIGKNLYVRFPNVPENPFGKQRGEDMMVVVCGALQIRTSRCWPEYDPKTKTASIMFHFTRPAWAEKAKARMQIMRDMFPTSVFDEEDAPPVSDEDLK